MSTQTVNTVRAALSGREASLSVAAIPNVQTALSIPRILPAPTRAPAPRTPDILGEHVSVDQGTVLPDRALRSVEALAMETGGLVLKNEWDLSKLVEHARGR